MLSSENYLAQVRILLERGRVFQQADNILEAKKYFKQSFQVSKKYKLSFHAINAAHMIAIVEDNLKNKIKWNQFAIDMAKVTKDKKSRTWLGALYNNLGQNYLDAGEFEKALDVSLKALKYRKKERYAPNIRFDKWRVARCLRSLGRLDEALDIQNKLLKEHESIINSKEFDIPVEMFELVVGWIYEELSEIYNAKVIIFAKLAYDKLANNQMFVQTSPERLKKLKRLKQNN